MRPNKGKLLALPTPKEVVYYFLCELWQCVLHPSKITRRRFGCRHGVIGRLGVMLTIIAFIYFALVLIQEKLSYLFRRVPAPAYATVCSVALSCFMIHGFQMLPAPAAKLDVYTLTEPFDQNEPGIAYMDESSYYITAKIPGELKRENEVEFMTIEPFMIAYKSQHSGLWNTPAENENQPQQTAAQVQLPKTYTEHTVEPNETLSLIASAYGVSVQQLQMYNPDVEPRSMQINQKIRIPGVNQPKKIQRRVDTTLRLPVNSDVVNSGYGYRRHPIGGNIRFHHGIDFKSTYGANVFASMDGKVVEANGIGALGRHVIIRHANGLETVYAHMSRYHYRSGDTVSRGQVIGEVGSTGRTTGPHLHFEIHKNGKSVNPSKYISFKLRNKN